MLLEALETRQLLASFAVTTVSDTGPGSLRQAILDNDATPGANTISFNIPGPGVHTISPLSPLPAVNNPATIDARTQPGYSGLPLVELNGANIFQAGVTPPTLIPAVSGLVLSGGASTVEGLTIDRFTGFGIVASRDGNTIAADFIGTDPTGTTPVGNGAGVELASRNNTIGGPTAVSRNLISGNGLAGIYLFASGAQPTNNVVEGNFIGTDVSGTLDLGNAGPGVVVDSSRNVIGGVVASLGNTIAFNGGAGVQVGNFSFESGVTGNRIVGNSIFGNAGIGIDLGNDGVTSNHFSTGNSGPNNLRNYPDLTSAYSSSGGTVVEGSLHSSPSTSYTVNFYSNLSPDPSGFGQGKTPITSGTFTTDPSGNVDTTTTLPRALAVPIGQFVTATATDASGNTSEFARSLVVTPMAQADLALTTSDPSPTTEAGVVRTYFFTVQNLGPSKATNATFTDTLPRGATFVSGTSSQGTVVLSNGKVVATLGTLNSGASTTITLTYAIATAGAATNQAVVMADQFDPSQTNNAIVQNLQVAPPPPVDIAVSATAAPDPVRVGDDVIYTFVVANNSFNQATGVTFIDSLPPGVTLRPSLSSTSQGTFSVAGGVVTANLGTIQPGSNATVSLVVTTSTVGPLTNSVTANGNEADPNALNNRATITTFVIPLPAADLSVSATAAPDPVRVGGDLTYTFAVANNSFNQATGVVFTDPLPAGLVFKSASSSQGTAVGAGGVVTANLGMIPGFSIATVTVVATPSTAGPLTNSATVRSIEPDPNALNNQTSVTSLVTSAPSVDVAVSVVGAPEPATVGQPFSYAVLVGNPGTAPATGVTLTDRLPDGVSINSIAPSQGTYTLAGNILTVHLGAIAPLALTEVTISLTPGVPGLIVDSASVTADQPDFNITNNFDTRTTTVQGDPVAPIAVDQKLTVLHDRIAAVVLTFNKGLDPTSASNSANYLILDLGANGSLAAHGPSVAIASAVYNPATRSVTLTPRQGLSVGRFYKVVVNGPGAPGLVDSTGNVLDGERNGLQNGIYKSLIGRGTKTRPIDLQIGVTRPKPVQHKPARRHH